MTLTFLATLVLMLGDALIILSIRRPRPVPACVQTLPNQENSLW